MKKSLITTFIVFLTLSLIGIMVLQGLWMRNAWESSQRDFYRSVSEAMDKVVLQVERREAATFITRRYQLDDNQQVSIQQEQEIQLSPQPGSAKSNPTVGLNKEQIILDYRIDSTGAAHSNSRIYSKADQINQLVYEMVMDFRNRKVPIDHRLPPEELLLLLRQELGKKGIDLPFQFAVVSGQYDSMCNVKSAAFTTSMVPASFRAALFPNDIIMSPYQLLLHFSDTRPYIIKSMWWMLLLSAIFLLLIIATFSSAIYIILKQKKVSEIKTDFINNMTHELKTPIATISIALDAINNPKVLADHERIKYYSAIIANENKRMNAHVENILQMALVDKEHFSLNEQLLNVHDVIYHVSDPVRMQVEKREGSLVLELQAENAFVVADEIHLTNVIHNLLDNACKYSKGAPEITVRTDNINDGLSITITDKGIGMSAETQKKIFEKFYREESGNIQYVKGFGLGLAYVKAVIRKHNGTVSVHSEPGKGSSFMICLPYGHLQH
ncbi:MAG: HAMP domain-containing histidine kinase [Chitinophagaceae bacterium]|nr:HAMP domain-containing histidine kinase [Chitinophagaceae bacterium]